MGRTADRPPTAVRGDPPRATAFLADMGRQDAGQIDDAALCLSHLVFTAGDIESKPSKFLLDLHGLWLRGAPIVGQVLQTGAQAVDQVEPAIAAAESEVHRAVLYLSPGEDFGIVRTQQLVEFLVHGVSYSLITLGS